ncbi:MAG: HK97 family phage prohead protease [Sulfurimonas sp.]|jgi:hypothetical protein
MTEDTTKRCFKLAEVRVDEVAGKPTITGLAVPYNAPSEDLGGFREVFKPGAFKESLAGSDEIFADVEHNGTRKLGRRSVGSLELKESREGVRVSIIPPDTTVGRDTIEEVRGGLLDGMSICFANPEDTYKGKGDSIVREISKASLRAVTLTCYPAYTQTAGTVAIRSLEEYRKGIETEESAAKAADEQRTKEADEAASKAAADAESGRIAESEQARARIELEEASL